MLRVSDPGEFYMLIHQGTSSRGVRKEILRKAKILARRHSRVALKEPFGVTQDKL